MYLFDNVNSGLTLDEISFIIMLFADNMVLFGKDVTDLQNSLELLYDYCQTWGLTVNPVKNEIVVLHKRGPILESEKWLYKGVSLEVVDNFNCLGVVFNYTGSFVLNQSTIAGKGLKTLNTLLANIRSFVLKPSTTCQLFDSFVGSVLCYGCEVCGFS